MRRRVSKKRPSDRGPATPTPPLPPPKPVTPARMGLQRTDVVVGTSSSGGGGGGGCCGSGSCAGGSAAAGGRCGRGSSSGRRGGCGCANCGGCNGGGKVGAGHYTTSNMFGLRAEGYELKADGKKRKFKPLEAMRKFFGKSKRKSKDDQVNVVAVKAKSTTALHHSHHKDEDDDDDDGGFKSHQRPLRGNRSISEDSVFSPEQRETNLKALKKTAVSEESLPKSAFQAELYSKLNKRRSQYSDEDDGLPHSPTPPVTTADIIMGGPLKPLPAAGKSTSRESDNSLISMDGSENDEEDPFQTKWKKSVPSKLSKTPTKSGAEGPIDFEKMEHTNLLKSDVAKDKISVKPRARKASRQSRKKREGQSPHSLPSLNEESPTKPATDVTDRGSASTSGSASASTPDKPKEVELRTSPDKPTSWKADRPVSIGSTPHGFTKQPSTESSPGGIRPKSTIFSSSPNKASATPEEPAKIEGRQFSLKMESSPVVTKDGAVSAKVSFDAKKPDAGAEMSMKTVTSKKHELESSGAHSPSSSLSSSTTSSSGSHSHTSSVMSKSESSIVFSPKAETASSTKPKPDFTTTSSSIKTSSSLHFDSEKRSEPPSAVRITISNTPSSNNSSTTSSTAAKAASSSAASSSTGPSEDSKKEGLRATGTHAAAAYSPKEEYKLRRQSRSKTLPEQPISGKEEQFSTKVQRAASHRVEATNSQNASPETSPRQRVKAMAAAESSSSKGKEPAWFEIARRKTGRQESEEKSESSSPTKETKAVTSTATPAPQQSTPAASVTSGQKTEAVTHKAEMETTSSVKASAAASKLVDTGSNKNVSSASSRFDQRFKEATPSEVTRSRGGSVKTSPTKTNIFSNRGGSVKVTSSSATKSEVGSDTPAPSLIKTTTTESSSSSSQSVSTTVEKIKEEPVKSSSPARDVPKWKSQSVKTPSAFLPSAAPASTASAASSSISSRFSSIKTTSASSSSTTTTTTSSSSATKTDAKVASPAKTVSVSKTVSEDKPSSVPAWRANLKPSADIKIELIESKAASGNTQPGSGAKKEEVAAKQQESPTKAPAASKDLQSDQCRGSASSTSRSSKVMNLLKNFENLQGVS